MIRQATHDDIPAILEMGRKFYGTTEYCHFAEMDESDVAALAASLIDSGVCLVADAGAVVGMVGLFVGPFLFNRAIIGAYEIMWWVDPEAQGNGIGMALLEAIEPACRDKGCALIQMVRLPGSPPKAEMLYNALGYKPSEYSHTKVL